MDPEKLKNRIAELLSVPESEKNIAFILFKNKLTELLKVGEALEIPELGIFHMQEKLTATKNAETTSNNSTLIFSPNKKSDDEESIFLTLDIEEDDKNNLEFDESVFNVGIDKPVLPVGDEQQNDESNNQILQKIDKLIANGKKMVNFDLWDDYLDKQSASILPEEKSSGDIDSYLQSDEIGPAEDDFMEIDEDELLSEFENTETSAKEDTFEVTDDEPVIDLTARDLEPANEFLEDIPLENEELLSAPDEVNNVEEAIEENNPADSEFYEAEDDALDEILEQIDIDEEKLEEDAAENKNDVLPKIDEKVEYINPRTMKKRIVSKKRYSPTIYFLIAAFFIVGAIGIYYLFFNNPIWLEDPNEVEIKLSEKHQKEFEEAKKRAKLLAAQKNNTVNSNTGNNDNGTTETKKKETTEVKKEETKPAVAESNKKKKTTTVKAPLKTEKTIAKKKPVKPKVKHNKTKVVTASNQLTEVGKNIYFDGKNYSLQVSSWPRKSLAEKEVNRLNKKGFNAFIMKAYIPRYQKYWYRVRIGGLATIGEAKKINAQLK